MKRFAVEKNFLKNGYNAVIGCDEVGRGCLAGPVVAAAVCFEQPQRSSWWKQIADSKTLVPKVREELANEIKLSAQGWGIGIVSHTDIDRINIHQASLLAMRQAITDLVNRLGECRAMVLVDGKFMIANLPFDQQTIVKGDALVRSIAAASIIAKVYRDELMRKLHGDYPQYGFDSHKGYATVAHRQAVKQHGLSSVHRVSFCGKIA